MDTSADSLRMDIGSEGSTHSEVVQRINLEHRKQPRSMGESQLLIGLLVSHGIGTNTGKWKSNREVYRY